MPVEKADFSIDSKNGKRIYADLHCPSHIIPVPLVIFFHGFKGFKDWGTFNLLAEYFANHNIAFVKFNAAYNGIKGESGDDLSDLESFSKNNFRFELDDVKAIIDACLHNNMFSNKIDFSKIILMGHSRGGAITILSASADKRISKLITLAAVSNLGRMFSDQDPEEWIRKGKIMIPNLRTGISMPVDYQLWEDYFQNREEYDIIKAASLLEIPHLVVHCKDDEAVPIENAEEIRSASKNSQSLYFDQGGHTFGSEHPWNKETLPQPLKEIADRALEFIKS